jgi:hypothetical protein
VLQINRKGVAAEYPTPALFEDDQDNNVRETLRYPPIKRFRDVESYQFLQSMEATNGDDDQWFQTAIITKEQKEDIKKAASKPSTVYATLMRVYDKQTDQVSKLAAGIPSGMISSIPKRSSSMNNSILLSASLKL